MIDVKKRNNETPTAMLFRFTKKVRQSGVMKEVRKRRFYGRTQNKRKRAVSAAYRAGKAKEISDLRKLGAY
jgi:ribosomal protein S21